MTSCLYDINKYVAKTNMSAKTRILVEGSDDKDHIVNLLDVVKSGHRVRVDTAEMIKGDCGITRRNNRAKIDKIYSICKNSNGHKKLYYLCDREFLKFEVEKVIVDLMGEHEADGNFSWTIGHSIENYFFNEAILIDAYRYLCGSSFKSSAQNIFVALLPSIFKLVANITLAAKEIEKSSYPIGVLMWEDFEVSNEKISLKNSWLSRNENQVAAAFNNQLNRFGPIVEASEELICSRICRGHTAMVMFQRIFSACIFYSGSIENKEKAFKDSNIFANLKESNVSSALCEAWLRKVQEGKAIYPINLVDSVS